MINIAENKLNPLRHYLSGEAKKRLRWMYVLYYEQEARVAQTARKIGISRQWLSELRGVFEKNRRDPRSLEPRSRAPKHTDNRQRIPANAENLILRVRDKSPGWGKEKIVEILWRDHRIKVGASTANRYLHKHGRIDPRISAKNSQAWRKKMERESLQPLLRARYRPPGKIKDYAPGALVEKDMKFVLKFGASSSFAFKENFWYQHTAIDSFTRIRALELVQEPDSASAAQSLQKARFPFAIATVNTDSGGENGKAFEKTLQQKNIFHFYSNTASPTDNPRVERSHLTDEKEFYQQGRILKDFKEQQKALKKWEYIYNYVRPHQALGYLTPMAFYQLWKKDPQAAITIAEKYRVYLVRQRKRLAGARRMKRQEQIEALMKFIDAKLNKKVELSAFKFNLVKCQLCSWT